MDIVLASRNKKKIAELKSLLGDFDECLKSLNVLSLDDIGFFDDIIEDGSSFYENAKIKAMAGASRGYITVADDSGLEVSALGGAPGIYSARYSGESATDEKNNAMLLSNLKGVQDRSARFVCAICCVFPDGREISVEEYCNGKILEAPMGTDGFGYDPLFYVEQFEKTFAQLSGGEKNSISHRGLAMREFAKKFYAEMKGKM